MAKSNLSNLVRGQGRAGIVSTPASPQASNGASQDASKPASPPKEPMIGKSYRFPVSHARRFAAWTAARGMTEQEATRLAQIMLMEQYDA